MKEGEAGFEGFFRCLIPSVPCGSGVRVILENLRQMVYWQTQVTGRDLRKGSSIVERFLVEGNVAGHRTDATNLLIQFARKDRVRLVFGNHGKDQSTKQ